MLVFFFISHCGHQMHNYFTDHNFVKQLCIYASVHLPNGKMDKSTVISSVSVLVGPCHHGMARPQVAERGTASDKEGSCE